MAPKHRAPQSDKSDLHALDELSVQVSGSGEMGRACAKFSVKKIL